MNRRYLAVAAIVSTLVASSVADAQPGRRRFDMRGQVFDLMFPIQVEGQPYFSKMILRFSDTRSQLMVLVYPGRKAEIIRHRIAGTSDKEFDAILLNAFRDKTITAQDIVGKLRVESSRVAIDYDLTLSPSLEELKSMRISPLLSSRAALDSFEQFEFWYDTWEESVHYSVVGPFNDPHDELAKWMMKFRSKADEAFKTLR